MSPIESAGKEYGIPLKVFERAGLKEFNDAVAADRRLLKKSGKLPEVMRGARLTFNGLSEWYTGL